jgi:hypothetical protein
MGRQALTLSMSICTQETIASASAFPLLPFWMSGSGPENPE